MGLLSQFKLMNRLVILQIVKVVEAFAGIGIVVDTGGDGGNSVNQPRYFPTGLRVETGSRGRENTAVVGKVSSRPVYEKFT